MVKGPNWLVVVYMVGFDTFRIFCKRYTTIRPDCTHVHHHQVGVYGKFVHGRSLFMWMC